VISKPDLSNQEQQFREFIVDYSKPYIPGTPEYNHRLAIFIENVRKAADKSAKDPTAQWGVTKFSDLTDQEFRDRYLIKNFQSAKTLYGSENVPMISFEESDGGFPVSYDWRNSSTQILTPVYNQEQCGSCWAFSITENIESMWALSGKTLVSLSMQQVVDCDTVDDGCGGGNPPTAYEYVIKAGGLELYSDYPYDARNGKCKFDSSDIAVTINNWGYITKTDNETAMMAFTYTTGPPSVCVDASTWSSYTGGIIGKDSSCGRAIDHCVQIVGWSKDAVSGIPYWIVRNSWGADWGPYGGFLHVEIGYDVCAIGQEVTTSKITA
jgi:cathepsin F